MSKRLSTVSRITAGLLFAVPAVATQPFAILEPPPVPFPYSNGSFGASAAVSGDTIAVGAPGDDYPSGPSARGAVFVFRWNGTAWAQEAKLIGSQTGLYDFLGHSVALEGELLAAGEPHWDPAGGGPGQVTVFRKTNGAWAEEAVLSHSNSVWDDRFGWAVAMSGVRIVAIVPGTQKAGLDPPAIPRVVVFHWTGAAWEEEAALTLGGTGPADNFAAGVAIEGDDILVGAPTDDAPSNESGSVFPFHWNGSAWVEEPKLVPSTPTAGAKFGRSIAMKNGTAFVASADVVWQFERTPGGWTETATIEPAGSPTGIGFGRSVAMDADTLAVMASEAAYLFEFNGSAWIQQTKIDSPQPGWFLSPSPVAIDGRWTVLAGVLVYCVALEAPCIPTLGTTGIVLLGGLLSIAAIRMLRRTRVSGMLLICLLPPFAASAADPRLAYPQDATLTPVPFVGTASMIVTG